MAGVKIRRATPADAVVLTALAQRSKAYWGYPPELLELWRPQLTVTPETVAGHSVWLAEDPAGPLGFYALSLDDGVAELEHLWVEPHRIGQGTGRALFEHAVAQATSLGALELRTVSDPNAEAFYLRMGAVRAGSEESVPPGRRLPVLSLVLEHGRRSNVRKTFGLVDWASFVAYLAFFAYVAVSGLRSRWWYSGLGLSAACAVFWVAARLQLGGSFSVGAEARRLVTHGLYSKVRHPIYVFGTMAFMFVVLALMGSRAVIVWAIVLPIQILRARREEGVLAAKFGSEYSDYRSRTWF